MGRKFIFMISIISGLLFLLSIAGELQAQVDWCSIAQGDAQQTVTAGGPYKNHGQMVKIAAQAANPYLYDGRITEECHSCIVNQFARNVPIAKQEACGSVEVECPCFDASDIEGQGIDYDATSFNRASCLNNWPDYGAGLSGCLSEPCSMSDWLAGANIGDSPELTFDCHLLDYRYGISIVHFGITEEEAEACIEILLNSQMWGLNCLLPD